MKDFVSIYIIGAIICAIIIGMSVFFIIKSLKRAKKIGMDKSIIKKTITSSAVFSIVPSIPIVIGIGIMMTSLGVAIPWIRLTVIGALQYELIAADQASKALAGFDVSNEVIIATAVTIMTLSILSGPLFNIIAYKKYQTKLLTLQENNSKLMNTITGALLGGLLAGMLSSILVSGFFQIGSPSTDKSTNITTFGEITLITLAASILMMAFCGGLIAIGDKIKKSKNLEKNPLGWIENYALPFTILASLAIAFGFTYVFSI